MAEPLILTNPHAVLAVLKHRPNAVQELRLPPRGAGSAWQTVTEAAVAFGITVREIDPAGVGGDRGRGRGRPSDRRPRRGEGQQADREAQHVRRGSGAHARVLPRPPVPIDTLFTDAVPGDRWLALDQVQDPQNVGSIFRTAAFFGVRGLIITSDRSAPMSGVVYDTASGGVEEVPHAVETNLRRALDTGRDAGAWVLGADEGGTGSARAVDRDRPWLLVVGNEERGLRRLTREACDDIVRIEAGGPLPTLNVAVATAVLLTMVEAQPPAPPSPA